MFRTILFPLDHSRTALETAATVLKMVQQHNSRLVLLSVVDSNDTTMANPDGVAQLLQQAHDTFERAGISCEAFVIGDVADEIEADLIVMGTRGISLENDQQSTAARVIQLAPCAVLVVP
jgi:nucleotide-binding universal stress UspA family protein